MNQGQHHKSTSLGFECHAVNKIEVCSNCMSVSNKTLSKFPCTSCLNTRKVLTLGHKIQVADADYAEVLRMHDARHVCSNFGGGWRLPTIEELEGMYEFLHKKGKGNFQQTWYWSSSESTSDNAWYFNFEVGRADYHNKYNMVQVRAVRDLP